MWRILRICLLLIVLATVARQTFLDQADLEWQDNFYVALYPINADDSVQSDAYIQSLNIAQFQAIETFFAEEAARYQLGMRRPVALQLGTKVDQVPPPPPEHGSILQNMLWSLSFRWFAWQNSPEVPVKPDIKLYLLFYDPSTHFSLKHSTALNKGRIGRVNLFADKGHAKKNMVVTAHELLHTLNASDKYNLSTGQPIYPDGYAEPNKDPLFPQYYAELMGAYLPTSHTQQKMPISLKQTLIGHKTATEIGWVR